MITWLEELSNHKSPTVKAVPSALVVGAEVDIWYKSAKFSISAKLLPQLITLVILVATLLTSKALGTNLWKLYVCNVEVDSTNNPNPWGIELAVTLLIITVFPVPAPLAIVIVLELGVRVVETAATLRIADCPAVPWGFVAGKLVSFAIASNPPTSSIRSTIRASIAPVVATWVLPIVHEALVSITSVESWRRNLPSASVSV